MIRQWIRKWACRVFDVQEISESEQLTEREKEEILLEEFLNEVRIWIDEHRKRKNSNNRFCLDVHVLQDAFPEFPTRIIRKGWQLMKEQDLIIQDKLDNEWIIK